MEDHVFTKGLGLFLFDKPSEFIELSMLAEELGYTHVWFADSQNIMRENYTVMGAVAVKTSKIVLGTGVTNPVTRHPSVLASTWATLHEMTGGRVALGIGPGDSALRTMGLKPMKLAEFEAELGNLRTLLRGDEVVDRTSGEPFHLVYATPQHEVPIYVAASAPKILQLSGRSADGVLVLVGTAPHFIEAALKTIEKGAVESGKTLKDLHIVLWTPTAIDEDGAKARNLVRTHVARVSIRPLPAEVAPADQDAIDKIKASYDYYHHMDTEAGHADLVPDSLVDLFALAGTPDECKESLRRIKALGVDQVAIVPFGATTRDKFETVRQFDAIVRELED